MTSFNGTLNVEFSSNLFPLLAYEIGPFCIERAFIYLFALAEFKSNSGFSWCAYYGL